MLQQRYVRLLKAVSPLHRRPEVWPPLLGAKFLGAGLASIAMAGAGVGIGTIFAGLMVGIARQPVWEKTVI